MTTEVLGHNEPMQIAKRDLSTAAYSFASKEFDDLGFNPTVETGRHNQAEATISWLGDDKISRSVQAWVKSGGDGPTLTVTAYAWKDEKEDVRRIKMETVSEKPFLGRVDTGVLQADLETAFKKASSWDVDQLDTNLVLSTYA